MIFLGDTGSRTVTVKWVGDALQVDGPANGFLGYRLDAPDSANGIYVQWEVGENQLKVSNDSFGLYPVFYRCDGSKFSFSSSILDLLENDAKCDLDDAGIALFLRLGCFVGNGTPFKNIRCLPPGTVLYFSKSGLRMESQKIGLGDALHLSRRGAIKHYGELFRTAILKFRSVFSGKIGVPITGGRDSRHILLELIRSGLRPHSGLTIRYRPPLPNEDLKMATALCSIFDMDHIVLDQRADFLGQEREKNSLTNFCSLEHGWILPLSDYFALNAYHGIFDGIGGDCLSAGLFMDKNQLALYEKKRI